MCWTASSASRAGDLDLAHVADVEQPGPGAHRHVLVGDAGVFDGHVPAAELDHARAERAMPRVERRLLQGAGGRLGHRVDERLPATPPPEDPAVCGDAGRAGPAASERAGTTTNGTMRSTRNQGRARVGIGRTRMSRRRPFSGRGSAFCWSFEVSRRLLPRLGRMPNAHIELWRVGDVKCQWMADWRRLRIVSQGVVLSDQTLASPVRGADRRRGSCDASSSSSPASGTTTGRAGPGTPPGHARPPGAAPQLRPCGPSTRMMAAAMRRHSLSSRTSSLRPPARQR